MKVAVSLSFLAALLAAALGSARAEEAVAQKPAGETAPATATEAPGAATVLVEVDDKTITQADVDARMADIAAMLKRRGMSESQIARVAPDFRDRIIEDLVTRALIDNEAAKRKIIVNNDEVQAAISRFKAVLPPDMRLEDALERQGMSAKNFEDDIREQLKLEKVLKIAEPTEEEMKEFYSDEENRQDYGLETPESVRARHILIAVDEEDGEEAKAQKKQKAEEARKRVTDGGDFAAVAKEMSDCPSKERGGDLGKFSRGHMVKEFEDAAFSQKTGEVGPVVETEFGYHIIEVTEHNQAKTAPFEEVKDKIAFLIKGKKVYEKAEEFLKELRAKAKIVYKNGARPPDGDEEPPKTAAAPPAQPAK